MTIQDLMKLLESYAPSTEIEIYISEDVTEGEVFELREDDVRLDIDDNKLVIEV